jgi:hypothetical protein
VEPPRVRSRGQNTLTMPLPTGEYAVRTLRLSSATALRSRFDRVMQFPLLLSYASAHNRVMVSHNLVMSTSVQGGG